MVIEESVEVVTIAGLWLQPEIIQAADIPTTIASIRKTVLLVIHFLPPVL
jgi:hypothetical protein